MTKEEFLSVLRGRLSGNMSQTEVESHIAYYASYIDEQMKNGKTMEDIVDDIGEPRIIAKTLTGSGSGPSVTVGEESYNYSQTGSSEGTYTAEDADGAAKTTGKIKKIAIIAAVVLSILIILGLIVSLVIGFLWILAPIILVVIIAIVILGFVGKKQVK